MKKTLFTLALASFSSMALAQEALGPIQTAQDASELALVGEAPFLAEQLIVRFVEGIDMQAAGQLLDGERYHVMEELVPALNMFLVRVNDGTRIATAIGELQELEVVQYASPDGIPTSRDTLPNDPHYSKLWQHDNNKMQTPKAWDLGTGDPGFVISVVDGGCRLSHPDLAGNLYVNAAEQGGIPNFDDDGNGYKDDINGWDAYSNDGTIPNDSHGTHCNGIAGAIGNNGTGVTGVAWNCELMPVAGSSGSTSVVTKAYNYVFAQKNLWITSGGTSGANVVVTSNSFGIDKGNCQTTYQAWNDLYNLMGSVGVLSCGATANANWNIDAVNDTPTGCSSPYMVSVTNTTSSDTKASSAGYGLTTIDLGAPGSSIYSTESNGAYSYKTGTSMATPQVAGAIGLLHSLASTEFANLRASSPSQAALELKSIILSNVDPLTSLNGKTVSGGRLNVWKAAQDISTWTGTPGGTDGTIVEFGAGLGGANIGTLASTSIPNIGTTMTLNASGFNNTALVRLVLSTGQISQAKWGGTLLVNFGAAVFDQTFATTGGAATINIPIPNSPAYVGFVTYGQCGGSDATQPQGIAMSNGLTITVGQ
ncbi:MAG: S8 family serine peptidase [Planctomycetota bacterium]|nr:S8 family serine peptidase [Planctomycetota bacterium]